MAKKIHSINIEEDIWIQAKSKGFNMSQFIENQLKIAIEGGTNNELELKQRLLTIEQEILTLQRESEIIKSQLAQIDAGNQSKEEKQQKIWQTIIMQQYSYHMINSSLLKEASEILEYPEETLENTAMEIASLKNNRLETAENMKKWDYVKQNYLE